MASTLNFQSILSLGISDSNSATINQKIKLSNGVALYFIFLSFVYVVIAIFAMPVVLPYALISLVLYILVPFLNQGGQHILSRYIAATNPSIVSFFIHISTISLNESAVPGNYLIQFSLMVLPWILFDSKEKFHLGLTFNICALLIILVRPLNGLIEPDATMNSELTRSAGMELIFMITSISILGISLYILQRINENTESEIAKLVKEADLKNAELKSNEDKLNKYIEEIELTRVEDKKREWTNNGLAKFADILRAQNNEIQKSYDAIITNLVKYLDANQGGLFVVEGEENSKFIELKSYYAYERKKYLDKRIEIGEGLVGQCYLEKDIVFLTKVPENFVTITSGLGEATPRCVLLVPLMLNDEVFGVIELASFKPFEQYQIDFLKKVGENTAATISNLKINERTKLLLEESQQQSEEMRSQEEEMRQNMEELSATQEEMARRQQEVEEALEEMKVKASMLDAAQEEISQLKAQLSKV